MTARAYWVDGVQLVSTGGELCEACEERPAVGRSIGGHAICKRCAGWASRLSDELAAEVEASAKRRGERHMRPEPMTAPIITKVRRHDVASRPTYLCGHPRTAENTYQRRDGRKFCRQCKRDRSAAYKARARRREQERMGFGTDGRRRRAS